MPELSRHWGRMRYRESGGGVPLVFLHGTGCDNADWAEVLACLPGDWHVVCVEFRGHGQSDVPSAPFTLEDLASDVLALAEARGWAEFAVIGHSLGGMVGLAMARHCKRVRGLILLEGWTSLSAARAAFPPERHFGAMSEPAIAAIKRKDAGTRARFEPAVWQSFWQTVQSFDAYEYLQRADIPILEVYGALGRREGVEQALRVPQNPQIAWRWIAGAGHYLPHEAPAAVAKAITTAFSDQQSRKLTAETN